MKLSPRNKLILVAAIFVLMIVVAVVVLIVPKVTQMSQLDEDVKAAENKQSMAQSLLDRRRGVRDRAVQNDATLLQLATSLPDTPELPSLIIELQDRAYENGVFVRRLEPLPPIQAAGKPYVEMSLNLTLWGSWSDTVDYLQGLQKMSRLVRVNEMRVEPITEQDRIDGEPSLDDYDTQTTMRITTYVLPTAADASATAAPTQPQQ